MFFSRPHIVKLFLFFLICILSNKVSGQDYYEIQVYESETLEKGTTFLELFSNYIPVGDRQYSDNVFPSDKICYETFAISHGFTNCFEVGLYFYSAIGNDGRTGYGGSHIRPRISFPESLNLPVGLSLSSDFGYQRLGFFNNHWLIEINPIIDKDIGKFYLAINTTFDWNIDISHDVEFNPCLTTKFKIGKKVKLGLEWYGSFGNVQDILPWQQEHQLLFLATDIDFGSQWEFNFGVGCSINQSTNPLIIKCIFGRGLKFKKHRNNNFLWLTY